MSPEDTLADLENLLRLIAGERTAAQPHLFDDALQEARIAAWERLEQGHPRGIALRGARQAVADIVRGRRMTGSKSRNKPITHGVVSLTMPGADGEEFVVEPVDHRATDAFAEIESQDALDALLAPLDDRDRRIATLTYLSGFRRREVAAMVGLTPQGVSYRLGAIQKRLKGAMA